MKQLKCRILSNREICQQHYLMRLTTPYIAKLARPGQFIHVKCSQGLSPFLRRPFSIHQVNKSTISILYRVIGRGTKVLSERNAGEYLDVIGPLGNGFDTSCRLQAASCRSQTFVLVAGGIGIAPLLMLAQQLKGSGKNNSLIVLMGAKTKKLILCKKNLEKLGARVKVATEDGSCGYKGMVTGLLKELLAVSNKPLAGYACGPEGMLKKTGEIAIRYNLKVQGSLERNMACGVGACLGCVVKTTNGYKRVCRDGPVFNLGEIIW